MPVRYNIIIVFLCLLIFSGGIFHQDVDVAGLVRKAMQNQYRLDYSGIVERKFMPGDSVFILKQDVIFKEPDKMYSVTLQPERWAGSAWVRIRWRNYFKRNNETEFKLRPMRGPNGIMFINDRWFDLFMENYSLTAEKSTIIADRDCYPVIIKSKYEGRPWIKAWIDKTNGFILQRENYNAMNKKIDQFSFETINFNPEIDENIFEISLSNERESRDRRHRRPDRYKSYDELNTDQRKELMKINYIPPGYKLDDIVCMPRRKGNNYRITYTDGLSLLAFSQGVGDRRSEKDELKEKKVERRGNVTIIQDKIKKYRISLVGDLTLEEMNRIFNSIEL